VCCESQYRPPQARIIDRAGEFKERNPVGRARLLGAMCRGRNVADGHDLQTKFVHGREVGEATQTLEQSRNEESKSSRPCGVVDVDSEDLIAYVRDSTLWSEILREQGTQLVGPCILQRCMSDQTSERRGRGLARREKTVYLSIGQGAKGRSEKRCR